MGLVFSCCFKNKYDNSYLIKGKYCYQCDTHFETKVAYDYHRYNCNQNAIRGGL